MYHRQFDERVNSRSDYFLKNNPPPLSGVVGGVVQNQQQIDLYSGKQMSLPAFRRMLAIAFHQFLPVCSVSSSASHNAVVSETARMLTPYRATHVSSIVAVFFAVAVIIVCPLVLCVVLCASVV